jgi:hypothetical protein
VCGPLARGRLAPWRLNEEPRACHSPRPEHGCTELTAPTFAIHPNVAESVRNARTVGMDAGSGVDLSPIYDEIRLADAKSTSDERSLIRDFLVCFSLRSNLRSIGKLAPQTAASRASGGDGKRAAPTESMSDIKVIHGLRSLSMVWIIFGHTIGLVNPEMMSKLRFVALVASNVRESRRAGGSWSNESHLPFDRVLFRSSRL